MIVKDSFPGGVVESIRRIILLSVPMTAVPPEPVVSKSSAPCEGNVRASGIATFAGPGRARRGSLGSGDAPKSTCRAANFAPGGNSRAGVQLSTYRASHGGEYLSSQSFMAPSVR